jgi:hypothetical protein
MNMSMTIWFKMPINIEVELNNKYGDIFIIELSGKVLVNHKLWKLFGLTSWDAAMLKFQHLSFRLRKCKFGRCKLAKG